MSSTTMMMITTTPTTQPATTPPTLEEESSLSSFCVVACLVPSGTVNVNDELAVLVAKELILLVSGPVGGLVSLAKSTVVLYIYIVNTVVNIM